MNEASLWISGIKLDEKSYGTERTSGRGFPVITGKGWLSRQEETRTEGRTIENDKRVNEGEVAIKDVEEVAERPWARPYICDLDIRVRLEMTGANVNLPRHREYIGSQIPGGLNRQ